MDRSCTGRCALPTSSPWCPERRALPVRTPARFEPLADDCDVFRHLQQTTDQDRGTAVPPRPGQLGPVLAAGTLHVRSVAGEIDISEGAEVSREDLGEWHGLDGVGLATGGHPQGDFGCRGIQATEDSVHTPSRLVAVV